MRHFIAVVLTVAAIAGATPAFAQESAPGPGKVVITIIPGGATFFTEAEDSEAPSFGNYELGGSVAVHFNRYVALEGEVTGALGVSQSLQVGSIEIDERTPNLLNYTGNLVVSAPNRTAFVPYLTGGVGGMTLFERRLLSVTDTDTFLTGNVGGGVSWYGGRWGLRQGARVPRCQGAIGAAADFSKGSE